MDERLKLFAGAASGEGISEETIKSRISEEARKRDPSATGHASTVAAQKADAEVAGQHELAFETRMSGLDRPDWHELSLGDAYKTGKLGEDKKDRAEAGKCSSTEGEHGLAKVLDKGDGKVPEFGEMAALLAKHGRGFHQRSRCRGRVGESVLSRTPNSGKGRALR